jgi:cell division septation protein DedD
MDQQLKQRLVGVAVIFLLAIIFVPMLLDGAGTRPKHLQVEIPERPVIEPFEVVEQKVIELNKQVEQMPDLQPRIVDEISDPPASIETKPKAPPVEPKPLAVAKAPAKIDTPAQPETAEVVPKPVEQSKPEAVKAIPKPAAPVVKKQVGGETWIIQAGSFNDKSKAYKLRNKLRKSRLASDVFIEKFPHNGQVSYRVRLGMFLTRNKAKIIANKLRAKYNIKGLVQKYDK